jgi:DNA-binding helix-hairpin-helix protein with protein kinase domain
VSTPNIIDAAGKPVALGRLIARGGEGAVYELPGDADRVAKVYHAPASPQTADKLAAMATLARPDLVQVAAWPGELLRDARTRRVAGFVMPKLADARPVQQLYNPAMRLREFPAADWAFQVRAARNLAAAFDEVHAAGCLVADVSGQNVFVTHGALARLLDCDSFQVTAGGKTFLCEVGTPEYTPPELQAKPFDRTPRTENHDRFGLAVLVYQLLFVGRHPYSGRYTGPGDPSPGEMIAQFRFSQGPAAAAAQMSPPALTPTFADIPPALGTLFRRAFEKGGATGDRPRAADWVAELERLEPQIASCPADPGHKHWRGTACPWCRLAANGGPEYYFGAGGTTATGFAVDEAKLQDILRRLKQADATEFAYDRKQYEPATKPTPTRLPDDAADDPSAVVARVVLGVGLAMILLGSIHWICAVIGVSSVAAGGAMLTARLHSSPRQREARKRRQAVARARDALIVAEAEYAGETRRVQTTHAEATAATERGVMACRALVADYQKRLREAGAEAERQARRRFLRLAAVEAATIPGVGPGRKHALADAGIVTADDVTADAVFAVSGFGEKLTAAVVAWRDGVAKQFRFDPKGAVSAIEQRKVAIDFRARQQALLQQMERQLVTLEAGRASCRIALDGLKPRLRAAVAALRQAEADCAVVA